jgi:hypothetical protein
VATLPIVKYLDPLKEVLSGFVPAAVTLVVDLLDLEGVEEAFHHRIDAPMSSLAGHVTQVCQYQRVQFPNDLALQAALDLLVGPAFCRTAGNIGTSASLTSHAHHRDGPGRVVGCPVAAPI